MQGQAFDFLPKIVKIVFNRFGTIKLDKHWLKILENAVSSFSTTFSSFFSESEIAVSSAKCVLRPGIDKAR